MTTSITEATAQAEQDASQARTGRMLVQAISAGLGSSGLYRSEVLERAARDRLIGRGTPLHVDHATETERHDRPERSVQTIAGVFTSDARWDAERQALVGEVQVFPRWREDLAEMAPYIGLSISGTATDVTEGEYEGRRVPVIEGLASIDSVDFVTRAGRGGKVLVIESAPPERALIEQVFDLYGPALREAGLRIAPVQPPRVPVPPAGQSTTTTRSQEDPTMPQIEEARLRQLEADAGRVQTLESERDTATQRAERAERELAESRARDAARPIIAAVLAESTIALPAAAVTRATESVLARVPLTEAGQLDETAVRTAATEARTAEETYVAQVAESLGAGRPRGLPAASAGRSHVDESTYDKRSASVFGRASVMGA